MVNIPAGDHEELDGIDDGAENEDPTKEEG